MSVKLVHVIYSRQMQTPDTLDPIFRRLLYVEIKLPSIFLVDQISFIPTITDSHPYNGKKGVVSY